MFETERLLLRPWTKEDADTLFTYSKDPVMGPRAGWAMAKSVEESRRVLMDVLMTDETYAIELKKNKGNVIIGCASLKKRGESRFITKEHEAEVVIWIANKFWNKGYATEALKEMLRHAFDDVGLESVIGIYFEGNDNGRRVLEKCGFTYSRMVLGKKYSEYWDTYKVHVMEILKSRYLNLIGRSDTEKVELYISKGILAYFRNQGGDWQSRINDILLRAVDEEIENSGSNATD